MGEGNGSHEGHEVKGQHRGGQCRSLSLVAVDG